MRQTTFALLLLAAGGLALGGCSQARQAMGLGKNPPDEFDVVTHPPLAMPPNYDLVKPDPGAPRPQEESATQLAEAAVIGNVGTAADAGATNAAATSPSGDATTASIAGPDTGATATAEGQPPAPAAGIPAAGVPATEQAPTAGEQAFLQSAGTAKADPKIRQVVNAEAAAEAAQIKGDLYYKIFWWQSPDPPGTVVNAAAEQQRLQENAALGQPLTQGATPVIVRRKKAALEGIF
jgi:hypothetical protein